MNKNILKISWIAIIAILLILSNPYEARAKQPINFPENELAQESVLPKFDRPESVKQRNVTTAKKFEIGGYYGWNILEPIENQSKLGVNIGYHLNEDSAIVANYAQWLPGLNTQYTNSLKESNNLDFTRAPQLKYSLYGHYEWKIFYGKISFTKQGVVNLSTYPIIGAGITAYEHKTYYGADFGVGQKFYFGKSFALRADFKMQYSKKPSPFLGGRMQPNQPAPSPGDFKDKWDLGTILDVGVSFLL